MDDPLPVLARLERVCLRAVSPREDTRFTPWLARPENLELLGSAVGLDLELEGIERSMGAFRADILCRKVRDDRVVLIENQLKRSDHTHLGQLITYMAGLDTATIIWIAAEFTDEHRAALDWLNAATDENFRFFGLEIQLWRIADSIKAPAFRVVVQPNDWTKRTRETLRSVELGEISELGQQRMAYWRAFREYLDRQASPLKMTRDYASGHVRFPTRDSPFLLTAYRSVEGPGVFVRVKTENPETLRDALQPLRAEIERIAGARLIDRNGDPLRYDWLRVPHLSAESTDESDWPRQFEWMADTLNRFRKALDYARDCLNNRSIPAGAAEPATAGS
jgi:Domain of unknown function (DUF4268)